MRNATASVSAASLTEAVKNIPSYLFGSEHEHNLQSIQSTQSQNIETQPAR